MASSADMSMSSRWRASPFCSPSAVSDYLIWMGRVCSSDCWLTYQYCNHPTDGKDLLQSSGSQNRCDVGFLYWPTYIARNGSPVIPPQMLMCQLAAEEAACKTQSRWDEARKESSQLRRLLLVPAGRHTRVLSLAHVR